jgi:hypothetical protein|tara:strand:- start:1106 stop:1261 length:156 start_codon:yes stop_codon:yes gene_type:complete
MKSDLEKAIIAMGEVLKEEGESLDGFDNQTLQDLSTLLAAHVEDKLDRVVH